VRFPLLVLPFLSADGRCLMADAAYLSPDR